MNIVYNLDPLFEIFEIYHGKVEPFLLIFPHRFLKHPYKLRINLRKNPFNEQIPYPNPLQWLR